MLSLMARRNAPVTMMGVFQMRQMGYSARYIGVNDMIRQERHEKRKYGMKRHFYDKEILEKMKTPDQQ